jgi:quercetin dioxygenase-like cupin family protein
MSEGYDVARVEDLDRIPVDRGLEWRPIRRRFGIRAFGMNAYTSTGAGDWVVEEHTESSLGHEEVYVVIAGRARFTVGDDTFDAPAGTLVHIGDPVLKRVAVAEEAGTTVLAVGGKPGEAFTPSSWEWSFEAYAQPPERGIATMHQALEEFGEQGHLYYHLACIEGRAGRLDDARGHLARAIELRPELAERAASDPDLSAIAGEAGAAGEGT